jgi:hypothetical protein
LAGGVALEAAADFGVGFLLGASPGQVVLGFGVVKHPPVDDDMQGAVELAVAQPVEPVTGDLARGCLQRAGPGQGGEGGLGAAPSKSRRTLALPARCVTVIREQVDQVAALKAAAGDNWQEHGLVFPTRAGTEADAANVRRAFRTT